MTAGIYKHKPLSTETKKKISLSHKGKRMSEESKIKMSRFRLGKKMSEKTKKRISNKLKGRMPKNIELLKNTVHNFKKGCVPWIKGKHHTKESNEKNRLSHIGKRPWNYIDGRSKSLSPNRYGYGWQNIRKAVLIRDNFTCQHCFIVNVNFDVHHKIPFLLTHDNSLTNLITLCNKCHRIEEARIIRELKSQKEDN